MSALGSLAGFLFSILVIVLHGVYWEVKKILVLTVHGVDWRV